MSPYERGVLDGLKAAKDVVIGEAQAQPNGKRPSKAWAALSAAAIKIAMVESAVGKDDK